MLKKSLTVVVLCTLLGACVTEPRDPDFAGAEAINKESAAKNRVSLGLTYLSNGNFSQAKANLDKALNFAPKSADAHFAMAYYYQQVDELLLAEEYYQRALKLAPENANIINSYGAFLCEQGRYEKAKSYFLKAVSSKSYVSTAETYENLAICAVDQGKTDDAIGFFESALNHQPTRGKSLFLLAQLQKEQGNYGEAKKTLWKYDRVSRVSPESLWLSYEIARGLGDTKAALGYGELMKSMFPEHPNTALFKKQMGKFQPVATVKNKRRAQPQITSEDADSGEDASSEGVIAETPALIKVNKKTKVLTPKQLEPEASEPENAEAATVEPILSGTEANTEQKDKTVVIVEVPTASTSTESASTASTSTVSTSTVSTSTPTTNGETEPKVSLSASEIAKREAELEAALAAELNDPAAATIDGAAAKVNNSLATADNAPQAEPEAVVKEVVDKAESKTAKLEADLSADAELGYHIVLPKENLYRISIRYNVKMKHLMRWNNLEDPSDIKIGMKLQVKDPKNND
jgi:type IV pilus assembly protein PilF